MSPSLTSVTVLRVQFANTVLTDAFRSTPAGLEHTWTPKWTSAMDSSVRQYSFDALSRAKWARDTLSTHFPVSAGTNAAVEQVEATDMATVLRELKTLRASMDERHDALKKTIDEGNEKKAALVAITNKVSVFSADGVGKGLSKIGETLSKGVDAIRALANPATTTNVQASGFFKGMRTSFMEGARATAHTGSRAVAKTLGGVMVAGVMAGVIAGAGYGLKAGLDTVAQHVPSVPSSAQVSSTVQTAIKHVLPGTTIKVGSVEISSTAEGTGKTWDAQATQRAVQVVQSLQTSTPGLSKESALRTAVAMSEVLVADSIVTGKSPEDAVRDQALLMALKRLQAEKTQPVVSVGHSTPTL